MRAWLRTRWVLVPGAMGIFIVGWLAYVGQHQHGVVDGWVLDGSGQPVAAATVLLFERGFVTHQERGRAVSGADGRFRFTDNRSHSIQLEAQAPGLGRSDRRVLRLWFAAQDTQLSEPLRFAAAP